MAEITLKGNKIHTLGDLPKKGEKVKDFTLTGTDLSEKKLSDFAGKIVLNIFPSLDTATCASSVRKFNEKAASLENTTVLCISRDLPFAHARFCTTEGIDKVINLSDFRTCKFGKDYQLEIVDGPLAGLLSRVVIVLDENKNVVYSQQVPEIVDEPDYDAAIEAVKSI
ncbi:MAG TPA: thiol peroxidase [Bacteroidetes bacterium]|nr:thiol peroxidase [Bacteroidota bacterium]